MAIDYEALKAEIDSDPRGMGYAAHVENGSDQPIADLLNATTGGGSASVTLQWQRRDPFLAGLTQATIALAFASPEVQAKWDRVLANLRAAEWIDIGQAVPLLQLAMSDGLIDDAGIAALTTRMGSRAEALFGADVVIQSSDVATALRGGN